MHKILLFCLLVPVLVGFGGWGRGDLALENRTRAQMPDLATLAAPDWLGGLTAYLAGLDAFVSDNVGFRDQLIATKRAFDLEVNGHNNARVIAGQDGWLFYNAPDVIARDNGRIFVPFRVTNMADYILEAKALAEKNGARFLAIPVPNKDMIYHKYLPDWAQPKTAAKTERDAIIETLAAQNVPLVDPAALFQPYDLDKTPLYFKRDTHWNSFGAYLAFYQAMVQFDLAAPLPAPDAILKGYTQGKYYGVLDQFLGLKEAAEPEMLPDLDMSLFAQSPELSAQVFDDHVSMDSFEVKYGGDKPKLLVVGDSFTYSFFRQYWGAVFSEVRWSHHNYGAYDRGGIDRFKPDYVIFEYIDWEVPAWRAFTPAAPSN